MNKSQAIKELMKLDEARFQRLYGFMEKGVHIEDPFTIHIADNVKIGKGTVIHPLTYIEEDVVIGKNCTIGPFARIRKHSRLKGNVTVGNFVEVNRTTIGKGSKAKHLTYLGDTVIGENANVGAGTIVANYDGKVKSKTVIKNGAFIGSGSVLVAPVTIGKNAMTGAGAVVTRNHNVPDGKVVVGVPARILKK
ncbi:MAG: DapH/DapD/GlmU-related protein [Candidatus Omnitrophica bacterium]|nr:DapH/DapD/GlmU-related protein [Candidatus Omnitrophota bacterium]